MQTVTPKCETCVFMQKVNDTTGICKRNPPLPYLEQAVHPVTNTPMIQAKAHYPVVGMNDWCGEHNLFGVTKFIDSRLMTDACKVNA